jgi:ATP-dependent protease ClpP protease subunit
MRKFGHEHDIEIPEMSKMFNSIENEIIYNGLTKKRTIHIWDTVDDKMELVVTSAIERMAVPDKNGNKNPIKIKVSTLGGSATSSFSIISSMESAIAKGFEIETYGYGSIMSAGTIIFASGTKRLTQKYSRFLLHDVGSFIISNATSESIRRDAEDMEDFLKMYEKILFSKTKVDKTKFRENVSKIKDWSFWGTEAVKMGLADGLF